MASESVVPTLRATVFAVVCVALGAGAHRAMSGSSIPAWALATACAGAYAPARYAAGRGEMGFRAIAALMGSLQLAFHLLFSYAQHIGASSSSGPMMAGMQGMSMPDGMSMPAGMAMPGMATASPMHMTLGMLLGHVVAALLCAWWLRCGEAALHDLLGRTACRLRCVYWVVSSPAAPLVDHAALSLRVKSRLRILRSQWQRGVPAQRGPPVLPSYL